MTEDLPNNIPPDEEIHLLDYLLVLAKHSQMIVFGSSLIAILTLIILLFISNKYTATTTLLPPQQNLTLSAQLLDSLGGGISPGASSANQGMGGMAAQMLGMKTPGDIYVGVLTGNTIFDRIIERFKLRELYDEEYIENVRKKLSKNALISIGENGLLNIEVTDVSPQRAADMANAFVEELDTLFKQLTEREASNRLAFLEKERQQASLSLFQAEEALRRFSEKNSVIQIESQARGMLEYIASLRAGIDAREVQLQVLRQHATTSNYDVIRQETEIKGLKERLKAAEHEWESCVGDVCLPTAKAPSLGLEYVRLYREVKFQEALLQQFLKMVELARVEKIKDVNFFNVVDKATPPEKKSSPKRLLITFIMGVFSLFFLTAYGFLLEYWHSTISSEKGAYRKAILNKYWEQWKINIRKLINFRKKFYSKK